MGPAKSHEDHIKEDYDIVNLLQDGSALLKHKKTEDEFLLRNVGSNSEEEVANLVELLRIRQKIESPHLVKLVQIKEKEEKQVCSVLYKIYLLIEYPFKTLKDDLEEKISENRKNPFIEAELWSILYSCCLALKALYQEKVSHQCLTNNQIFINKEGFIKISDPLILGLEKNYITVMKKSDSCSHISPEIMNFLDDCNFSYYDKEKSDVFILAVLLLEATLLKNLTVYDKKTKRSNLETLPSLLDQARTKYSAAFVDVLSEMLQLHSKKRPTFGQILSKIEEENSMCGEEAESSRSKRLINEFKNQNPIPPPLHKNTFTSDKNPSFFSTEKMSHTTPIGNLNTNNFLVNTGRVQFVPSSSPYQYNQSFTPSQPQYPLQPAKADDRFSYNKFGNISLNTTTNNYGFQETKPIVTPSFTSQVPEVNDLLSKITHLQKDTEDSLGKWKKDNEKVEENWKSSTSRNFQTYQPEVTASYNFNKTSSWKLENPIPSTNIEPPIRKYQFSPQIHNPIPEQKFENISSHFNPLPPKQLPKPIIKESMNSSKEKEFINESMKEESFHQNSSVKSPLRQSSVKSETNRSLLGEEYQGIPGKKGNLEENIEEQKYVCLLLEGGGKYEGFIKNGMKNGEGKLDFKDGGFYSGEWKDNKMKGYGKLHYENGQIAYEGQWEDDQFNGSGRVFNDKPENLVTAFNFHDFADLGDKWIYYEGEFKSDSKHGKGKIKLSNGEVFEGNFIYDTIEGEGVFYSISGEAHKGFWRDNMLIQ